MVYLQIYFNVFILGKGLTTRIPSMNSQTRILRVTALACRKSEVDSRFVFFINDNKTAGKLQDLRERSAQNQSIKSNKRVKVLKFGVTASDIRLGKKFIKIF